MRLDWNRTSFSRAVATRRKGVLFLDFDKLVLAK